MECHRPTGRWHSTTILQDNAPVTAGPPVQYCNRFIFPLPGQVVPVVGSLLEIPNCYSYRSWSDSQATSPKRNLSVSKSVDKTHSTARNTVGASLAMPYTNEPTTRRQAQHVSPWPAVVEVITTSAVHYLSRTSEGNLAKCVGAGFSESSELQTRGTA